LAADQKKTPRDSRLVPNAPTVREASEQDYEALSRLWEQLDRFHAAIQPDFFRWPPRPRPWSDLRLVLRDGQRGVVLVAAVARRIVGALTIQIHDLSHQPALIPRRRAHIEDLVVDEGFRRQGIGRLLMDRAARWCEQRAVRQMVLTVWNGNDEAMAFYRRAGYRPINAVLVQDV